MRTIQCRNRGLVKVRVAFKIRIRTERKLILEDEKARQVRSYVVTIRRPCPVEKKDATMEADMYVMLFSYGRNSLRSLTYRNMYSERIR